MRKIKNRIFCSVVFALIVLSIRANAQLNLIPNASFEDTVSCPYDGIGAGSGGFCELWYSCSGSPDYWTECSSINTIPNTGTGFQYAHSGTKMMGIATYATPLFGQNFREILGIDLSSLAIVGQKYFFSMFITQEHTKTSSWVNLLATNRMGMRLVNSQCSNSNLAQINNLADYCDSSFHVDTANWVKISGSFIANGNYSKIQIGNFYDDINTDTINLDQDSLTYQFAEAYYYVDDVCLSADSLYATTWTGIDEQYQLTSTINIYPNPVKNILNVEFRSAVSKGIDFLLTDLTGKIVLRKNFSSGKDMELDLSEYPAGMYFLNVYDGKENITRKIIKL